jgi:hypothetical protein
MASAAGNPSLELAGFDQQGILANDDVEVRLYERTGDGGVTKKFVLATKYDELKKASNEALVSNPA